MIKNSAGSQQRAFVLELITAAILILSPFLFYTYLFASDTGKGFGFLFIGFQLGYYPTMEGFLWLFNGKALMLLLLLIWFRSCKSWWKYVILAPFWITLFEFTSFLNLEFSWFDDLTHGRFFMVSSPFMAFLILVSKKPVYNAIDKIALFKLDSGSHFSGLNEVGLNRATNEMESLRRKKNSYSLHDYLINLSFLSNKLEPIRMVNNEVEIGFHNLQDYFKKSSNKKKITEILVALTILAQAFIFYVYELAPDTPSWKVWIFTLNFQPFSESVRSFMWLLNLKFFLIAITLIWYLTCKYWWKYAILSPLVLGILQLISLLNRNVSAIDEIEYKYSLPIVVPIIMVLIFLSQKLNYMALIEDAALSLKAEIEEIISGLTKPKVKTELEGRLVEIKKRKGLGNEVYLENLINYRDELRGKLNNLE